MPLQQNRPDPWCNWATVQLTVSDSKRVTGADREQNWQEHFGFYFSSMWNGDARPVDIVRAGLVLQFAELRRDWGSPVLNLTALGPGRYLPCISFAGSIEFCQQHIEDSHVSPCDVVHDAGARIWKRTQPGTSCELLV